jgi:tetratricopeptide (TPR) repeat protein
VAHPSLDELTAMFQAARKEGEADKNNPEQLRLHRELLAACPAFTPNLLRLARLLQLIDQPEVDAQKSFAEAQRLLEQAVQSTERSAPSLVELGYLLDDLRNAPEDAFTLYQEGAAKALETLEYAWAGMIRYWTDTRTRESLSQALQLGERALKVFPESERILYYVTDARRYAMQQGLLLEED